MGANISHRSGKCLKNRRAKSEEHISSKSAAANHLKCNMGRFLNPWNTLLNGGTAAANGYAQQNGHTNSCNNHIALSNGYYGGNYQDWIDSDATAIMQKTLNNNNNNFNEKSPAFVKRHSLNNGLLAESNECSKNSSDNVLEEILPVITKDSIFEVTLNKGSRGLGFSILEYDGLILIKQLFPLETASQSGLLKEGDIILSANRTALSGLSSFEALHVLRTTENPVQLIMCRIQHLSQEAIQCQKSSQNNNCFNTTNKNAENKITEFEINIKKIAGSLGFTLRKEGDGECSHLIRALVKEPAISDGRIKPGDQIVSVNGVDIGLKSHQDAVKFLRDCDVEVILKLRRATSAWSLSSMASSQHEIVTKPLRKEALEMLNDLAVKKSAHKTDQTDFTESGRNNDLSLDNGLKNSYQDLSKISDNEMSVLNSSNLPLNDNFGELADEPVSLPALDVSKDESSFQHSDPAYHSINVLNFKQKVETEDIYLPNGNLNLANSIPVEKNIGLLKWKNVVLESEVAKNDKTNTLSEKSDTSEFEELITVELQRSWNSRLGFSLCPKDNSTIISKIHEDSIAAKDGRLKPNDQIIEINGKDVKNSDTNEIIDILRNVRGITKIIIKRVCSLKKPN